MEKKDAIKLGVAVGLLLIAGGVTAWNLVDHTPKPAAPSGPDADAAKAKEPPVKREGGGVLAPGSGG